ncbi:mannitol-1-phosphate 5-dehydrogenase [Pseudalkalibacillus hwajinpoensis]|uniref:Mannitol-1-phosphate 5-dehydrogenase n=1 Tax=Guptibacillus hwajinpoensis TaxID=208199 RepID=A0A4U1MN93_9BACL|nr:mannitol-1-phosphate 5-dehydrogenase [Pseudalkalibacillus hwajinpoensis]TKD72196.1 mannitol-1-phosphate 5-dehydrogenase [Pseudalkalibacillus hwajinpoensis]
MKALHFGAGNIGRGLIGYLLNQTGYHLCFVDADQHLIDQINEKKRYVIELLDKNRTQETVYPVRGVHTSAHNEIIDEIVEADFITTSVGVHNLPRIAPVLSQGLLKRKQLNKPTIDVMANENAINASSQLKEEIRKILSKEEVEELSSYVGFPNSAIDRLSLSGERSEGNVALVEPYYEWVINRSELVNEKLPQLTDATYVDTLMPYIERKLFIVNMGHATTAYMAHLKGYPTIQRAFKDERLKEFVRKTMHEAAGYFTHTYEMEEEELATFIENTIRRFQNENMNDDIQRVARAPIRKLGPEERLVKPTVALSKMNLPIGNLTTAIAGAFLFNNPEDEESVALQAYIEENGIEQAITHFTQIKESNILLKIKETYLQLKKEATLKN